MVGYRPCFFGGIGNALLVSTTTPGLIGVNARYSALLPDRSRSPTKPSAVRFFSTPFGVLPFATHDLGLLLVSSISVPKALVASIGL